MNLKEQLDELLLKLSELDDPHDFGAAGEIARFVDRNRERIRFVEPNLLTEQGTETVDDLANQVADWIGCYGGCKHTYDGDGCNDERFDCCRVGFMLTFPDRIRAAVKNELKFHLKATTND